MKTQLIRMIMLVFLCAIAFPFSAQDSRPQQNHSLDRDDQNALSAAQGIVPRTDLEKMQALLDQMQRNVAFVSPGDTPLKHQFQLEIEMWQLLIRDMQKNASTQQTQ